MAAAVSEAYQALIAQDFLTNLLSGQTKIGLVTTPDFVPSPLLTLDDLDVSQSLSWGLPKTPTYNEISEAPNSCIRVSFLELVWDWTAYGSVPEVVTGWFCYDVSDMVLIACDTLADGPINMDNVLSQCRVSGEILFPQITAS